jgi:hypothetical protein
MPTNKEQMELERKFEKLAEGLRRGWAKMHPLTEKEKGVVRDAVREQWNEEQKAKSQSKEKTENRQSKTHVKQKTAQKDKKKSQDRGHGFDHSH